MDEQVKNKLLQYLETVEGSVQKAVDFTSDQVPLYVKELCEYGFFDHGITAITCLTGAIIIFMVCLIVNFLCRKLPVEIRLILGMSSIFLLMLFGGLLTESTLRHAKEAYKCKYAPRVYIVEKIHELTK